MIKIGDIIEFGLGSSLFWRDYSDFCYCDNSQFLIVGVDKKKQLYLLKPLDSDAFNKDPNKQLVYHEHLFVGFNENNFVNRYDVKIIKTGDNDE